MTTETESEKFERINQEGKLVQQLTTEAVKGFMVQRRLDLGDPQNIADAYARFAIECVAALVLNGAPVDHIRGLMNRAIDQLADARALAASSTAPGGSA